MFDFVPKFEQVGIQTFDDGDEIFAGGMNDNDNIDECRCRYCEKKEE